MSPAGGGYRIPLDIYQVIFEYVPRWRGLSVGFERGVLLPGVCPPLAGVIGFRRQKNPQAVSMSPAGGGYRPLS